MNTDQNDLSIDLEDDSYETKVAPKLMAKARIVSQLNRYNFLFRKRLNKVEQQIERIP